MAEAASIDHSWLSKLERGEVKRPGRDALAALAQALEMDVHELFVLAGWEQPPPGSSLQESIARLRQQLYSDVHLTYEQAGALVTLYEYYTRSRE